MRRGVGAKEINLGVINLKMVNEAIIMDGIIQGEKRREGKGRGEKGEKKAEVRMVRSLTFGVG